MDVLQENYSANVEEVCSADLIKGMPVTNFSGVQVFLFMGVTK